MLNEKKLTYHQRKNLSKKDFGVPELRAYPLTDKDHVIQAIRLFNKVDPEYEATLAGNLIKAIKRFKLDVNVGDENRFKKYYAGESKYLNKSVLDILEGKSVREVLLEIESIFKKGDIVVAKDGFLDKGETLQDTLGIVVDYNPENDFLVLGTLHPEKYALPHTYSMRGEFYRLVTDKEKRDWDLV